MPPNYEFPLAISLFHLLSLSPQPGKVGGSGISVHPSIPCTLLLLHTVTVLLSLFPSSNVQCMFGLLSSGSQPSLLQYLVSLVCQFLPPLLLFFFNLRHSLWGDSAMSSCTLSYFSPFHFHFSLSCVNDGPPTHYHCQTTSFPCIDVSLCSPFPLLVPSLLLSR